MRIAVLGLGRLGAFHAKVLRELPGVSELRVYDADEARASTISAELGLAPAASIDAALEGADAAVIVTPTGTHAPLIHRCLDARLAVFCEKPIALDLDTTKAAVLRLRGGAVGLLGAARHNEAGYDVRVEVYGAKDTIAIGLDPRAPLRSVEKDAPKFKSPAYPSFFVRFGEAYRAELAHFLRFARGEAENVCTVVDGMEALRLALAARRSLEEHRPVGLYEIA